MAKRNADYGFLRGRARSISSVDDLVEAYADKIEDAAVIVFSTAVFAYGSRKIRPSNAIEEIIRMAIPYAYREGLSKREYSQLGELVEILVRPIGKEYNFF